MAGPITRSAVHKTESGPTAGGSDSSSSLYKSNMVIKEDQAFRSPSAELVESPQPQTPATTSPPTGMPGNLRTNTLRKLSVSSLPVPAISGALAPRPTQSWVQGIQKQQDDDEEAGSLAERRGASLNVDLLNQVRGDVDALSGKESSPSSGDRSASEAVQLQQDLGGSSRPGQMDDDGVLRKDTVLTAQERNSRLENLEQTQSPAESRRSTGSIFDKGWNRPFPIEWIKVQRLPFHRTRHLKNGFNADREVKM